MGRGEYVDHRLADHWVGTRSKSHDSSWASAVP